MANKIKSFKTNESTSRTQSITVNLPNLRDVVNIRTNTGTATYTVDPNNKENIIITARDGSYSRRSSYRYWVEPHSKPHTVSMGYSIRAHQKTWFGSYWGGGEMITLDGGEPPHSYDYDDGTYSGVLHSYNSGVTRNPSSGNYPAPANPSVGTTYIMYTYHNTYEASGTITRPGYYSTSYTYYYQYDITVEYTEQGAVATNSATNINEAINISVEKSDETFPVDLEIYIVDDNKQNIMLKEIKNVGSFVEVFLTEEEKNLFYSSVKKSKFVNLFTKAKTTIGTDIIEDISQPVSVNFVNIEPILDGVSYKDISEVSVGITGNDRTIIQEKSYVQLSSSRIEAREQATLKNLSITIGSIQRSYTDFSKKSLSFNFGSILADSNTRAILKLTDSRGFETTQEHRITVVPYFKPYIVRASSYRYGGFEKDSFLSYEFSFSKVIENYYRPEFRIRELPNGEFSSWRNLKETNAEVVEKIVDLEDGNIRVSAAKAIGSYNTIHDYEIQVRARDPYHLAVETIRLDKGIGLVLIDKDGWEHQQKAKGISRGGETDYLATITDTEIIDAGVLEDFINLNNGAIVMIGGNKIGD